MNSSELMVFYSRENLTIRFADYSNVYILPSICVLGMFLNMVNMVVTLKARSEHQHDQVMKYILINSFIDFSFFLTQVFLAIIRCGSLCPYGFTYAAKFYEIYVYLYVGYVLITFQVILNIHVTIQELRMQHRVSTTC
jgi:hypothetical protein